LETGRFANNWVRFFECAGLPAGLATRRSSATATAWATTAAREAVSTATATESGGARFPRARLVDRECPATKLRAVQSGHCLIGIGIHRHFHKGETPGLPRLSILHDLNAIHLSICGESRIQVLFGHLERYVPDINVLQRLYSLIAALWQV
jgi:hypothetical protein